MSHGRRALCSNTKAPVNWSVQLAVMMKRAFSSGEKNGYRRISTVPDTNTRYIHGLAGNGNKCQRRVEASAENSEETRIWIGKETGGDKKENKGNWAKCLLNHIFETMRLCFYMAFRYSRNHLATFLTVERERVLYFLRTHERSRRLTSAHKRMVWTDFCPVDKAAERLKHTHTISIIPS